MSTGTSASAGAPATTVWSASRATITLSSTTSSIVGSADRPYEAAQYSGER